MGMILMELQDKKYNENLGKTNTTTTSPKDGGKAFSELTELDELNRSVRIAEMEILLGKEEKEKLELKKLNIKVWKDRIKILENAVKLESELSVQIIKNSPPKVEDKHKIEYIPNSSSTWKKIDFSGKTPYKHPNSEVLKPKKPWWKFW